MLNKAAQPQNKKKLKRKEKLADYSSKNRKIIFQVLKVRIYVFSPQPENMK